MLNEIKEIILDYQELSLKTGISRRIDIISLPSKATVCIGVRRCGKSTYMFQKIKQLLDTGVPKENILYLNFFDDRLRILQSEGLGIVNEAYFSIFPQKKNTEHIYYFFDEIQIVPGWEEFVERLMRTESCDIFITGSSAQMLSKEIATQLGGRSISWEMFPFSFQEYLDANNISFNHHLSTKQRLMIQKAFDEYWQVGGFPEVISIERFLRIKIHQEYFNALLFRDLIERHNISNPKAIIDIAHWLVNNIASLYSINKLTGYLKSQGYKIAKSTVSDYLTWFEDAFFLFSVRIYDSSISRSNTNPKKIYCIDHSMVTSISSGILINSGHLLENLVFVTLRRVTNKIYYFKSQSGKEVDFIVQFQDGTRQLIQVCETMVDSSTKKREVTALEDAMIELGLEKGIIVTRQEEEEINLEYGKIQVISAWRFLLSIN